MHEWMQFVLIMCVAPAAQLSKRFCLPHQYSPLFCTLQSLGHDSPNNQQKSSLFPSPVVWCFSPEDQSVWIYPLLAHKMHWPATIDLFNIYFKRQTIIGWLDWLSWASPDPCWQAAIADATEWMPAANLVYCLKPHSLACLQTSKKIG